VKQRKKLNLALQGGGAHGAFGWGILDYLLEDGRLDFEGLTATSAGAVNATIMAQGLSRSDYDQTRQDLHDFWEDIAQAGLLYTPVKQDPFEMAKAFNPFLKDWSLNEATAFNMFSNWSRTLSPYQFNPLNINPLRDVLEKRLDFETIHQCDCIQLFISTTNVRTGNAALFHNKDITMDVLLASTTLPFLFQAVEINGDPHWDGGYMGNPSLWPLFYKTACRDILILHINPIIRDETPTEPHEIENRLNEITFNASLLKELRAIDFVQKLITQDMLKDEYKDQYKSINLHAIRADEALSNLSVASKFDTDWTFLKDLRDLGRQQAALWIKTNYKHIGKKSSVDIKRDYLNI